MKPRDVTLRVKNLIALSVSELEALVLRHNQLYWDRNSPEIPDTEYDRLVLRLKELSPSSPVLSAMGPSAVFGSEVRHARPMLSLDKCYTDEDLAKWGRDFTGDVVVMPKFDGCACSILYDNRGRLVRAATRGDGTSGEDITANVLRILDVPKRIPTDRAIEIRGEVYMKLSVFEKFRAEGHANPRNLAAGAIKQKDPEKSAAYGLSFAAYDALGTDLVQHRDILNYLAGAGFPRVDARVVSRSNLRSGYDWLSTTRPSLDYEIDGVVFRADSVAEQNRLGANSHHPRYSLAYKFQGDSGVSILRDVEWSVSRTGAITPVAIVDPVSLSGASVSRASLHNAGFIRKLGISYGAEVEMMRRGGVIPNVERVVKAGKSPVDPPPFCPSCGAPSREEADFLLCSLPSSCKAAVIGTLSHFATTLDMLGFGDVILEQAYDAEVLRSPVDFYTLKVEHLSGLGRCGEKTARKLVGEVDRKRTLDLATFLRSLGIPELGRHVSKILSDRYGDLDAVLAVSVGELEGIPSIGTGIATSVVRGLGEAYDLIRALRGHVTFSSPAPEKPVAAPGGVLAGFSFVFTGKLVSMGRSAAEDLVRQHGGAPLDSVSKALTHLVVGDDKSGPKSSKEKAAEKLLAAGAPLKVVSETEFLAMIR